MMNSRLWKFREDERSCCRCLKRIRINKHRFRLVILAFPPVVRVSCAPPRETDTEKVVEEGIACTKYVVPIVTPPKMDEDAVKGAKRIAQLMHMQRK